MAVKPTSSTASPDNGTGETAPKVAAAAAPAAAPQTGAATPESERKTLPNGKANMSPSGAKPDPVVVEAGIKPLKALHQIIYGANQVAPPESIFTPVSAKERAELLVGEYPAAKEPSKQELALFREDGGDADSDFE